MTSREPIALQITSLFPDRDALEQSISATFDLQWAGILTLSQQRRLVLIAAYKVVNDANNMYAAIKSETDKWVFPVEGEDK